MFGFADGSSSILDKNGLLYEATAKHLGAASRLANLRSLSRNSLISATSRDIQCMTERPPILQQHQTPNFRGFKATDGPDNIFDLGDEGNTYR